MKRTAKAIFLDRDGVVIKMHYDRVLGIIETPLSVKQITFAPGIFEFLHFAKNLGYLLIIISNQPAVGIKKLSLKTHKEIRDYITKMVKKQEITFDKEYYCMHHPYASILKYRKDCDCRKPKTGFFKQAAKDFNINLKQSWVIGDGVYDIIAGHAAGCKTILVGNILEVEYLQILKEKLGNVRPDYLVKYVNEAKEYIK